VWVKEIVLKGWWVPELGITLRRRGMFLAIARNQTTIQMIKQFIFANSLTNSRSANSIPLICFLFIRLQAQPKGVEMVKCNDTM
jgi:hypothetical protein